MRTNSSPLTNLWLISSVYPRESCGPTSVFARDRGSGHHTTAAANKAAGQLCGHSQAAGGLQTPLGRAAGGVTGGLLEGRAVGTGGGPALECVCRRDGRREEAEAGCSVADAHIPKQSESGEHGVGRGPRGSPDLTPDTTAAPVPESVPLRVPVRCHQVSSNCQHTGNGSSPNHTTWICFSYFW